jgi:prefoldin subunit 5
MAALEATNRRCAELEKKLEAGHPEVQEWKDKYETLQVEIEEELQVSMDLWMLKYFKFLTKSIFKK